ncbi:FAD/NADP-binding domain-containing protein [Dacryopinax primogenitus]|uniref:FAD/NADP-binding domain-containing protein n=1 Tax=Dacryopinax primogenitus (strain DJM 731) TaxID=1858805 RepID=M5G7Z5_DACPD|nr:FAD/NADP-binding domain-containing protein [Dacryopinax primogenitus]EJU01997.1 FAD/NADP-binding domain-containing protein [Dacryopinax primogenitus]
MEDKKTKVLVIGAGAAGPILALVLEHKGFLVEMYERHPQIPQGGLAMQLSGQSFKVLNLLGLAEGALALALPVEHAKHRSELSGRVFLDAPAGAGIRAATGWPICTVNRSTYTAYLLSECAKRGIKVFRGKRFLDLEQDAVGVKARFADGTEARGEMLVGCDGVHSTVRDVLFGKTPAEYTGLIGIAGYTPYTATLRPAEGPTMVEQVWGDGCHFVSLPMLEDRWMWAVNMPEEADLIEDWRTLKPADQGVKEMLRELPCYNWSGGVGEVIKGTTELVKFGLYLRSVAPVWHKGRAVLLGDAAHPTTPFLGQGANQATEDVYHLVRLLLKHAPFTEENLDKAFTEYANVRMDRVRRTIEQTKKEGDLRMIKGREACLAREEGLTRGMGTETWKIILEMISGPFTGEREI